MHDFINFMAVRAFIENLLSKHRKVTQMILLNFSCGIN